MTAADSSKDNTVDISAFFIDTTSYALHDEIGNNLADFFDAHREEQAQHHLQMYATQPATALAHPGALTAAYNGSTSRPELVEAAKPTAVVSQPTRAFK